MSRISDTGKISQSHSLRRIIYPNSCIHSPTNRVESFWGFIQWPHSFVDQRLIRFLSLQAVSKSIDTTVWYHQLGFLNWLHHECPQDYNPVSQVADHPSLGPALTVHAKRSPSRLSEPSTHRFWVTGVHYTVCETGNTVSFPLLSLQRLGLGYGLSLEY